MACPVTVVALLIAALGAVTGISPLLVGAIESLTVAFGIGQPAMIPGVSAAVESDQRGVVPRAAAPVDVEVPGRADSRAAFVLATMSFRARAGLHCRLQLPERTAR